MLYRLHANLQRYRFALQKRRSLRIILWAGLPLLMICLVLGSFPWAMLTIGYLKLCWSAADPQELVEVRPVQRFASFVTGLQKLLLFTAWMPGMRLPLPLCGIAVCQWLVIAAAVHAHQNRISLSPMFALTGTVCCLIGLFIGNATPLTTWFLLPAALGTPLWLSLRPSESIQELRMRFHLA